MIFQNPGDLVRGTKTESADDVSFADWGGADAGGVLVPAAGGVTALGSSAGIAAAGSLVVSFVLRGSVVRVIVPRQDERALQPKRMNADFNRFGRCADHVRRGSSWPK
jgi:hypothetical protein